MDSSRRHYLIERYKNAVSAVLVSIDHVAEDELDVRPTPKAWSARQVVHHLAGSELHEAIRLRRMLAENRPVLVPWDGAHDDERLHYNRPILVDLEAFKATALSNIELLHALTDEQWRREGNQQKPWSLTVESWLEENVTHVHDHLMQILNAPSGGRAIPDPD
jgi:hypothetical protein